MLAAAFRFAAVVMFVAAFRFEAVVFRRPAITAVCAASMLAGRGYAVFSSVLRFDLVRKERRKRRTYGVLLNRSLSISCRKYTKLNRYDYFFLTCYAYCDNKVAAYTAVIVYRKISAAVIGRQPRFTSGVAEFRKSRQEGCIQSRRHTNFKKVGKYQRLCFLRYVDVSAYGEYSVVVAAVAQEQI